MKKKQPMQPQAPSFAPPPSPGGSENPPDLLDEFSQELNSSMDASQFSAPSDLPPLPEPQSAPDMSSDSLPPARSSSLPETPTTAHSFSDTPQSIADVSDDAFTMPKEEGPLPDFSEEEIAQAKALEEQAKNPEPEQVITPDSDDGSWDSGKDWQESPETQAETPETNFEEPITPETLEQQEEPEHELEAVESEQDSPMPWEQEPLPQMEQEEPLMSAEPAQELAPEPALEPLPAFENAQFVPVPKYRDMLSHTKELRNDLKKGTTHLGTALKHMNQHKQTFTDFAENLRTIELELLRMDEMLR